MTEYTEKDAEFELARSNQIAVELMNEMVDGELPPGTIVLACISMAAMAIICATKTAKLDDAGMEMVLDTSIERIKRIVRQLNQGVDLAMLKPEGPLQ